MEECCYKEKCSAALSTEIASIGLCQPQSRPHKTSGNNLLMGQPLFTPKKEKLKNCRRLQISLMSL